MRKEGESPGRVLKGPELETERRGGKSLLRERSILDPEMLNDNSLENRGGESRRG